jgi:hypothetical protein
VPPPLADAITATTDAATRAVAPVLLLPPAEVYPALMDTLPATVEVYGEAAAAAAADWYDLDRAEAGVAGNYVAHIDPVGDRGAQALAGWATQPFRKAAPGLEAAALTEVRHRLEGGLVRRVADAGRDTITTNSYRDPGARGWVRIASGDACTFCKLLAARGRVYSKAGARFSAHDRCKCSAAASWTGQRLAVRPYKPSQRKISESQRKATRQWIKDNEGTKFADLPQDLDAPVPAPPRTPPAPKAAPKPKPAAPAAREPISNPFAITDELAKEAAKPAAVADEVDRVLAEATKALEDGDDALADKLFAKADKLEAAQQAKAAAAAADMAAKNDKVLALIEDGWAPDEAEAEAFGITVDKVRRRNFIASARADGHTGAGFDELVGEVHAKLAAEQFWEAEAATNGYMLKRQYVGTFDPMNLWTVNDATARKVMSEEMAAWFDARGGRVTRPVMRQAILDGTDVLDLTRQGDYLQ